MEQILQCCSGTLVYFDDILVTGKDDKEHIDNVDKVLRILKEKGLRLKRNKCAFMKQSIEYLGYLINKEGLHTDEAKVQAVVQAPTPTNVSELRSLLGLVNYYGRFIPNCSTVLHPLNRLLHNDVRWRWTDDCEHALAQVKEVLSSHKVLTHYSSERPLVLATDASAYGIGAVLSHVMEDETELPIAFASQTLTKTEMNYSQMDKEALGIIFGVKRFHQYLYGRKWTLLTDHKPLTSIFHPEKGIPSMAAARLQRWALILSAYTYDIQYRNTTAHANADCMSRLPMKVEVDDKPDAPAVFLVSYLQGLPVTHDMVQAETRHDPLLGKVIRMIETRWAWHREDDLEPFYRRRNELSTWNGCIMWGVRLVIPLKLQHHLLQELHSTHLGIVKMKAVARSFIWWPGLDKDIENIAATCHSCQQTSHMPAKAPIHPWLFPSAPWQRVHVDCAGPFQNHMFLVVCDAYSKWPEVVVMKSTTAAATIEALQELFSRWGLPDHLHSDNGPQFVSSEFEHFLKMNGVVHTKSAPYHPSSNGLAERLVQTVKQALKASDESVPIQLRLSRFLLSYRNAPSATTNMSPAELMLGRAVKTRLHLLQSNLQQTVKVKQTKMADSQSVLRQFNVGETVLVRNYAAEEKWEKGKILSRHGVMYSVQFDRGGISSRHIDQLRKCSEEYTPNSMENTRIPLPVPKLCGLPTLPSDNDTSSLVKILPSQRH